MAGDEAHSAGVSGSGTVAVAETTDGKAAAKGKRYVALVFFHGIGQQRRYESTASLLEGLDDWVFANVRTAAELPSPRLEIKTRSGILLGGSSKDESAVVYQQADYNGVRVRLFEAYWAPATVLGTSATSAFVWLMRQLLRPIAVLRAPWRSYARLRRSHLLTMANPTLADASADSEAYQDARSMVGIYRKFVEQRDGSSAGYRQFLRFVESAASEDDRERLLTLARRWHRCHVRIELTHLAWFAFVALSMAAGLVLLTLGIIGLLHWAGSIPDLVGFLPASTFEPSLKSITAVMSLLFSAIGIAAFLRNYIGDIQQFVTYEEIQPLYDRRQRIIEMATSTLKHVLADPDCERVVIVAHSLGTAVALDAVQNLRASNEAANPDKGAGEVMKGPIALARIRHFITFGCPIDKINYFFAALRSTSRSYESLIERLRGDITSVPFSGGGRQPYVHWINFWDYGDPISGPIDTVAGDVIREQRVDNVQVASYLWPDPAASHQGYFTHRDVLSTIFRATFLGQLSFQSTEKEGKRPERPWLGPGLGSGLQRTTMLLAPLTALFVMWAAAASVVGGMPAAPLGTIAVLLVTLIAGAVVQRRFRLHQATIPARSSSNGTSHHEDGP